MKWISIKESVPPAGKLVSMWRKKIRRFCIGYYEDNGKKAQWRATSGNLLSISQDD